MYYQPEAMLEQYDIEIKQITKGRGVFCCETDQGKKVLAPFRGSAERAKFVREILCSMQEKGYPVEQVSCTLPAAAAYFFATLLNCAAEKPSTL